MTACTDNDKKDAADGPNASASATATPGDDASKKGEDAGSQDNSTGGGGGTTAPSAKPSSPGNDNCPQTVKGAKLIRVDRIDGADNTLYATDAARRCAEHPGTSGAPLYPVGQSKTYSSIVNASITFIDDKRGHRNEQPAKSRTAVSHVKTCAEPNGGWQHGGAAESGEYCEGGNFYEVQIRNGQIVHMEEVYE